MGRLLIALFAGTGITASLFAAQQVTSDTFISKLLQPGTLVSHTIFSTSLPSNYTLAMQATFVANAVIYSALVFVVVVFFEGPRSR